MTPQDPRPTLKGFDALVTEALGRDGVFTTDDAYRCGVNRNTLSRATRSGRLLRMLPRVYVVAGLEMTWWTHARAAALWSEGAVSHLSAAYAHGFIHEPPPELEVVTTNSRRAPVGSRLRCHQSDLVGPPNVTSVRGIAVTAPARTLLDIASRVTEEVLELALEDGLRRGLVSNARLDWQIRTEGGRGREGTAALRRLLEARSALVRTESALETRVARWFRSTRLPGPVLQHRVVDTGRFIARVDFAYPEARIAVEATSYRWHSGRKSWLRDEERRKELLALGWKIFYVTEEDLAERGPQLEAEIAGALGISLF